MLHAFLFFITRTCVDDVLLYHRKESVKGIGVLALPPLAQVLSSDYPYSCTIVLYYWQIWITWYIGGLVQDCSTSFANALEILQSCTNPSILVNLKYKLLYIGCIVPVCMCDKVWHSNTCMVQFGPCQFDKYWRDTERLRLSVVTWKPRMTRKTWRRQKTIFSDFTAKVAFPLACDPLLMNNASPNSRKEVFEPHIKR